MEVVVVFFFKQKTAYEVRISDWSSDVCSSDLPATAVTSARQPVIEVQTRAKLRSRGWPPVSIGPSFLIYRGRVGRPCRFPGQQVPECHDRGYKSGYQLCPPVSSGSSKLREIRDVERKSTRLTSIH